MAGHKAKRPAWLPDLEAGIWPNVWPYMAVAAATTIASIGVTAVASRLQTQMGSILGIAALIALGALLLFLAQRLARLIEKRFRSPQEMWVAILIGFLLLVEILLPMFRIRVNHVVISVMIGVLAWMLVDVRALQPEPSKPKRRGSQTRRKGRP
jgi:hypothetical protein